MKHLKKYNESKDIIKSDNIFYFDNPNIKDIIEDTLSNLKDMVSSYKISHGWITDRPTVQDNPHFDYDQYTDLKDYARTINLKVYECYKVVFYEEEVDLSIEYDGVYYSNNVEFLTKIVPEIHDSVNKLNNIDGVSVSFNLSGHFVDLLVYVPFK